MDTTLFYFLMSIIVVCGVYVMLLYKNGKKVQIMQIIQALVYEAEMKLGSGTGDLKYEYVVKRLYAILPSPVKIFISDKLLDTWIEIAVDELQEILDREINKSHS